MTRAVTTEMSDSLGKPSQQYREYQEYNKTHWLGETPGLGVMYSCQSWCYMTVQSRCTSRVYPPWYTFGYKTTLRMDSDTINPLMERPGSSTNEGRLEATLCRQAQPNDYTV